MAPSPQSPPNSERVHLTSISVTGLNGDLTYSIGLKEGGITLITGPNGYGKTSIIRLVDAMLGMRFWAFGQILFNTFQVELSNGAVIRVAKKENESDRLQPQIRLSLLRGNREISSENIDLAEGYIFDSPAKYTGDLDYIVRELERNGVIRRLSNPGGRPARWRGPTGEPLDLDDIIRRFVRPTRGSATRLLPEWFIAEIKKCPTDFVNAQRLQASEDQLSVMTVAKTLREEIQRARNRYNDTSQRVDQEFPKQILSPEKLETVTADQLEKDLTTLNRRWTEYRELSLLADTISLPIDLLQVPEDRLQMAGVYVRGLFEKLSAFLDIQSRMTTFRALVNEHFELGKRAEFDREQGIRVLSHDNREIPLGRLSSGEQHLLVLFGNLLFGHGSELDIDSTAVRQPALVLIDEPELSLHPAWQQSFLDSIERIKQVVAVDFIMATHAPALVKGHKDLLVDLWDIKNEQSR